MSQDELIKLSGDEQEEFVFAIPQGDEDEDDEDIEYVFGIVPVIKGFAILDGEEG